MNKLKEKKLNNKGFSLVELIIVIAIMAVLIGVLAPQYLKYVERSRNSTDQDNAAAIESALQVWGAETIIPSGETAFTAGTYTVTVTNTGATAGGTAAAAVTSALRNAGLADASGTINIELASRSRWDQYVVTAVVGADGTTTVSTAYSLGGTAVTP